MSDSPGASNLYHSLRFSSNLPRRQENPASSTPYKRLLQAERIHQSKMEGSNQEALVVSMGKELYDILPLYPMCSICRVPEKLRRLNENAYTPRVVSIGPFHHGKESLKPMEEHKKRYLQNYLQRNQISLEECINKVRSHEAKLPSCYAETVEFSSDKLVKKPC